MRFGIYGQNLTRKNSFWQRCFRLQDGHHRKIPECGPTIWEFYNHWVWIVHLLEIFRQILSDVLKKQRPRKLCSKSGTLQVPFSNLIQNPWWEQMKNGDLSIGFSVQRTGGSPTGPVPLGDQDIGSPGRPVSSGLQVPSEPGHCRASKRPPLVNFPLRFSFKMSFNCTSRDE